MGLSTTIAYHKFLMEEAEMFDGGAAADIEQAEWNSSAARNETFEEPPYDGPEWIVVPIVFGIIFIVGVVGNGTLIFTVFVNKNMRSTPNVLLSETKTSNVLLVSLAVGDLLLILFTVPFMSTVYTFPSWPFGELVCKLGEFIVSLSLGVSVFTLTALSAERYMVIVHPMSAVLRSSAGVSSSIVRTLLVTAGIWAAAAALGSVELIAARVDVDEGFAICHAYPDEWGDNYVYFHVIFRFVVYFALPITTIAFFYALMARMLIVSTKQMPGEHELGQAIKQMEARKKVARLVLSFVVIFMVCWLPRHIYYFWFYFDPSDYNMFWHLFKIVAYCLSFVNSCVNPLALYFLSRQFRRYYDRYLFCGFSRAHQTPTAADQRHAAVLLGAQQRNRRAPVDTSGSTRAQHERLQMTVVDAGGGRDAAVAGRRQKYHTTGMDGTSAAYDCLGCADHPRTASTEITVGNVAC